MISPQKVVFLLISSIIGYSVSFGQIGRGGFHDKSLFLASKDTCYKTDSPCLLSIEKKLHNMRMSGHLSASVDLEMIENDSVYVLFTDSALYTWGQLLFSDSLNSDFRKLKRYQSKKVNIRQVGQEINSIVLNRASVGYPYFKVMLYPEITENNQINLEIKAEGYQNPVVIDTIVLPSNSRIKPGYLLNYLGIKSGDLFNYKAIMAIEEKLGRLTFVLQKAPVISRFSEQGAILELPVEAKTAGSFGGIVGFSSNEFDGKIKVTGDIHLKLQNSFKSGELINLLWKKTASESQSLLTKAELPYLLGGPIGFYTSVDLQKMDTTLLLTNNEFMAILHLTGLNQFRAGVNYRSNRFLASSDSAEFDTRSVLYKGEILFNNLDNGMNPSKGLVSEMNFSIGNREIKDFTRDKDLIYSFNGQLDYYFRISPKQVVHFGVNGGIIVSPRKLWPGELFRLGGMYSIRGFDEQAVTADKYVYSTFEYRYRFEKRSNAFLFTQVGDYTMTSLQNNVSSYLFSAGAGATIDTGGGAFSITYALGTSSQQPLKLKTAKIHFGYLVNF